MSLTPRQHRIAADTLSALAIASVGVALAGLTWRLAGFAGEDEAPIVPAPRPAAGPADTSAALAWSPFGRASGEGAPATTLPLELRGILLAIPREASAALIAPTGGRPIAYAIGALVGGATIDAILADRVTLRIGDRLETLSFPKATQPPAGPAVPVAGGGLPSDAPPPMQALGAPAPAQAAQAAAGIAERFGATITAEGYRIGTPPAAAAVSVGLQPGDLIRSLNGQPLGDPARDARTLASARVAGTAQVEIVRAGRTITLTIPVS